MEFVKSPPGIFALLLTVVGLCLPLIIHRRLRVLVHRAFFSGNPEPYYFINVTNLSRNREIEIVNIWFETTPPTFVRNPRRTLPKRLKVDETWETWIAAKDLPQDPDRIYKLCRFKLSNGKVVTSRQNKKVSAEGTVPGT